jgi:hypothetical protein
MVEGLVGQPPANDIKDVCGCGLSGIPSQGRQAGLFGLECG